MTSAFLERDYLRKYGHKLIDQGYSVIPIQQGKKEPGFKGWQKSNATKGMITDWLANGFAHAGVGIMTKFVVAIDIDVPDEDTALKFERLCLQLLGPAPVRIGKAPKRLLVYRTVEPFKKKRSNRYQDEFMIPQMIEVLAEGQQFVAYHIHPDTRKPYTWVDDRSPLDIPATELTEITTRQIDKILALFNDHCEELSWDLIKKSRSTDEGNGAAKVDLDNPWIEDTNSIEISTDELRSRLMLIPVDGKGGTGDYETWHQVGMALFHQFDGEQEGLDLWDEWSETSEHYDQHELEQKWKTFDVHGKGRAPLTARYILRLAKESIEKTTLELGIKLRDAFVNAKDLAEWEKARQQAREAEIDGLARSVLAQVAKDRRDAITGSKTPLSEIKKAIAYLPRKLEKTPKWAEEWVYDVAEDKFFHTRRKIAATKQGFDAMYDRQALTKKDVLDGKSSPSQSASDLALNMFKIPTVDGRRYMPGRDAIFTEPDGIFCNTYAEQEIPEVPEKLLPKDVRAIEIVKKHIKHLIKDPTEQRMLLDWMAWVVQNPGKHMNYAILLQGVEGDGKTFFAEMLRAVMGVSNVAMALANTILKSDFTAWAYGQCVCCVEEIRIVNTKGVDKWDAINKVKPFITNNVIEIHPKGKDPVNVLNTTSYMLFSNYQDALPLDENSRRYNVFFSRWQHKDDIEAFIAENPHYYDRLYQTLGDCAGALRKWLLEHETEESFNPFGRAPETTALRTMIRKSKSEFIQVLDDVIAENKELCASRDLIDVTDLHDVLALLGVEWPGPKGLATTLERDGYVNLGKVKTPENNLHTFYTKKPDRFTSEANGGLVTDPAKVRAYLKQRAIEIDDSEL